eukprot:10200624-Alexandrium_andersonii.AAC.1
MEGLGDRIRKDHGAAGGAVLDCLLSLPDGVDESPPPEVWLVAIEAALDEQGAQELRGGLGHRLVHIRRDG